MYKRIFSLFLAIVLLISCCNFIVFADDSDFSNDTLTDEPSLTLDWDEYVTVNDNLEYGARNMSLVNIDGPYPQAHIGHIAYNGNIKIKNPIQVQKLDKDGNVEVELTYKIADNFGYPEELLDYELSKTYTVHMKPKKIVLSPTFANYDYPNVPWEQYPSLKDVQDSDAFGLVALDSFEDVFVNGYIDYLAVDATTLEENEIGSSLNVGSYFLLPIWELNEAYAYSYDIKPADDITSSSLFTVSKGTISPAPTGEASIYYGKTNPISITVDDVTAWTGWTGESFTSIENVTLKSGSNDKFIINGTNKTLTLGTSAAAGDEATITVTCGSKNYNDVGIDIKITLIDKTSIDSEKIVITGPDTYEYNGEAPTFTPSYENAVASATWTVSYSGSGVGYPQYGPTDKAPIRPGNYTVTYTYEDNEGEFGYIGTNSKDFTITPRVLEYDWRYSIEGEEGDNKYTGPIAYCGKKITVSFKFTNLIGEDVVTVSIGRESTKSATNVGEYIIELGSISNGAGGPGANYKFAEDDSRTLNWEIAKADSEFTQLPEAKTGLVYNAGSQQLIESAGTTNDGEVYFKLNATGEYTKDITEITAQNAGTYNIFYYIKGDDNHNDSEVQGPLEVGINKYWAIPDLDDTNLKDKIYDGTCTIPKEQIKVYLKPSILGTNFPGNEKPTASGNFVWNSPVVGTTLIRVSNIKVDEAWATNYDCSPNIYGYNPGPTIVPAEIVRLALLEESYLCTARYQDLEVMAYGEASTDPGELVTVKWYTDSTYTTEITATNAIGTSAGTKTLYAKVDNPGSNHKVGEPNEFKLEVKLTGQSDDGRRTPSKPKKKPEEPQPQSPSNPFIDVDANKYYYDAVLWAYENGITSGLTAYTFGPNVSCSRAQVVTFLWRAAGCPSPSLSTCAFTDVESGSYYEQAVLWAVEKGITTGTSATTFSPDDTVTRSQVVTFLYRTVGAKTVATSLAFGDVDPDKYYADAVAWAVEEGITTGTSANTFSPDDDCTRGQIVTFLYRFFGLDK